MTETARRFFEVWCHKNLDYDDNPEASKGAPPKKAGALIADAASAGITEQELSDTLGGNIQSAVFDAMMERSHSWEAPAERGRPN